MVKKYNWREGDEILCINNLGRSYDLTVGKKYIVRRCYKDYNAYQVEVSGDETIISVFCSRFKDIKDIRKEKLHKLKFL